MIHTRTHLNVIFCAGALMTLQAASAQNASSKIRFTNGLHGGVDIARSSMAMTDKHPLATDLSNSAYHAPASSYSIFTEIIFDSNTLEYLNNKPWETNNSKNSDDTVKKLIKFINDLDNPSKRSKLAHDFPILNSLSKAEKNEITRIVVSLVNYDPYNDDGNKLAVAVYQIDALIKFVFARTESEKREPKNVNCLGFQTRIYGDESIHTLDYLYGNRHPSVDIGLQTFWGSSSGVGIGFRFPLFRLNGLNDVDPKVRYQFPSPTLSQGEVYSQEVYSQLANFAKTVESEVKTEQARYIKTIQHPTLAFVGGARTIDHIGQTYNAGVNFSILRELKKNGPSAEFLASTQYFWFHSRLIDAQGGRAPSSETVRFGLGFALNDRMVEFKKETNKTKNETYTDLKYWHWQAGAEYSFKNRLTEGDTVTGYVRNRDNIGNEFTVYAGVSSQQGFYGFAFAKKFN